MKKLILLFAVPMLVLNPSLSWSTGESSTQPTPEATAGSPVSNDVKPTATGATPIAQAPPDNWTTLKGTVQSVDSASQTLQIKDETGNLFLVPMNRQVSIQKDGKPIKRSQFQSGDVVVLTKKS